MSDINTISQSDDLLRNIDVGEMLRLRERNAEFERELAAERKLADKLAAQLTDIEAASNDDEVDSCDFRKSCRYDIPKALAAWKEARNPAQTTVEGAE